MSGEILLRAEGVGKRFGGFVALNGIDLEVRAGERLGLIGPNGSGKSTFVNCLGGSFPAHEGRFVFDGKPMAGLAPHRRGHLGLARTFQLPRPFNSLSVLENVAVPLLFRLNAAGTTIIMIEHVMRAVREFSQRLVVFVAGNKIADGDPNEVLAMPDVEEAYLGR